MAKHISKDFTYRMLIKQAILAHPEKAPTTSEIFHYALVTHPSIFTHANSMTWKGNIRQTLSLSPDFVKQPKAKHEKQHKWMYIPIEQVIENDESLAKYLDVKENAASNFNQNKEKFWDTHKNTNKRWYDI